VPPGSCWSTGAEGCRACRSHSPHSCWEPRAPLSRAWKTEGVLVSAQQRLRHEVSMDDDLGELGGVLTAPACSRSVDDQEPRGWGRSPRSGPYHAPRAPPGARERASSTEMIIDNMAAYAIRRSHHVVGLPIGKSRVKADAQVVMVSAIPMSAGLRCQTPISHTPSNPRSAISSQ
jgi:hypothetical protein